MKTKVLFSVWIVMAIHGMATAQTGAPYIEFYSREEYVEPIEPIGPQLVNENATTDEEPYPLRYNPYRNDISIRMTTWSRTDMMHAPARDLLTLAALSPSAEMRNGTVSVWGSEYPPLILVDGVKIRGTAGMPLGAVQSMVVLTGNIPACWGDTPGGVISITTLSTLR